MSDNDIKDACLSFRHDFGLMNQTERDELIYTAREWSRCFGVAQLQSRVKKLEAEQEKLVWNLAGVSTICCAEQPSDFNAEWARPALDDANKLATKYVELSAKVKELEGQAAALAMHPDFVRIDWMEDNIHLAIEALKGERDAVLSRHMLRDRIDKAMTKGAV